MKRTFIILNEKIRALAAKVVSDVDFGHEVIIREHKEDRSNAQNRISHMWYGEIAAIIGGTAEEVKRECKLLYGCPILIADNETFAEAYKRTVSVLPYEDRLEAMRYMDVTSIMSVTEMSKYLDEIDKTYSAMGFYLSHPEDLYLRAMR